MGVELKTAVVWGRFLGEDLGRAVACGAQTAILVQCGPVFGDVVTLGAYVSCGLC
jgi:hypothetical protein